MTGIMKVTLHVTSVKQGQKMERILSHTVHVVVSQDNILQNDRILPRKGYYSYGDFKLGFHIG